MDKVREFSAVTGLTISISKSKFYFGRVDEESNEIIQQTIGFVVGTLSVKYLGVPLASKKLTTKDCQSLIDRMLVRFKH